MASSQERWQYERLPIDVWSIREKLSLVSAVVRNGDQDWAFVSHTCKGFAEPGRPRDWFSHMNCAIQYAALLETSEIPQPKRSKFEKEDETSETRIEEIVRVLTQERCAELKRSMAERRAKYLRLKEEISLIDSGQADDRLEQWTRETNNEVIQHQIDAQNHALWLNEREERVAQLEQAGQLLVPPEQAGQLLVPPANIEISAPASDLVTAGTPNSVSQQRNSKPAETINVQLRKPVDVDILVEEAAVTNQSTPTSPLLLSLLKTSSPMEVAPIPSTLPDDAQSQQDSTPTIESLLSTSPSVPCLGMVPRAQTTSTRIPTSATNFSVVDPTLSKLLEVATNSYETVLELAHVKTAVTLQPDCVHHPQHQEMRVSKETESDEILEVVEVEQHHEVHGKSNTVDFALDEILTNVVAMESDAEQLTYKNVAFVDSSSDSLALLDSVLQSADIVKVNRSEAIQNVVQMLSTEVNVEQTKDEPVVVEKNGSIVVEETLTVMVKEVYPVAVEKQLPSIDPNSTNTLINEKLNLGSSIVSDSLLVMEKKSVANIRTDDDQSVRTDETFYPKTLVDTTTMLGKVQEVKGKVVINKELDVGCEPKKEILNAKVFKSKSSQNGKKDQKSPLKSKPLDKFDEMVNEGVPKQKDPKIKVLKAKESEKTTCDDVDLKELNRCGAKDIDTTGIQGNCEQNLALENTSSKKIMEHIKEEKFPVQVQETTVEGEVMKDPVILSLEGSSLSKVEESPIEAGSKREALIENPVGTFLMETSSPTNVDPTLVCPQSSGHVSVPMDSKPNSPACVLTKDERDYKAWKKAVMLVWSQISSHKYSSLFLRSITDDQAPHYSSRVKRPIDLATIKKNIETGATRCTNDFQRDILLMFVNAQMYNSSQHDVHNMAKRMQEDSIQLIKDFRETQKMMQSANEITAVRRETRMTGTDALRHDDLDGPHTPLSFKRKRVLDLEKSTTKKQKCAESTSKERPSATQ